MNSAARRALRAELGSNWSTDLTLLAERLLREAEELYGERDQSWNFLGVQVGDFEANVTWPIDKKKKLACICLRSLLPSDWPDFLLFNLSHETVHMLSPPDTDQVTYLEEGAAVRFSLRRSIYKDARYICEQRKIFEEYPTDKYAVALRDVNHLLRAHPTAIAELRTQHKSLASLTPTDIASAAPNCAKALAERLCRRFGE
jgi:hypothetical protein